MQKLFTLAGLKRAVDFEIDNLREYNSPEDIPVLITLSESSVGARASAKIISVGMGMDWEHGQFRLEPDVKLVKRGNSLSDIKSPRHMKIEGRNYYFCNRCGGGSRIAKDDNYCRNCGQRLK